MLRKVVFWSHLTGALVAGVVILVMSVTGVLMAFEPQIVRMAERGLRVEPPADATRRDIEAVLQTASRHLGEEGRPTSLVVLNQPDAPIRVQSGQDRRVYVDPYRDRVVGDGFPRLAAFFEGAEAWHRWLDFTAIRSGRAVTGLANLVLLFLLLSGVFLWFPRSREWRRWRAAVLFRRGVRGRARNFNWHNVLGSWSALPLIVIVGTAVVTSYPSFADRVYPSVGRGVRGADLPPPSIRASAQPPTFMDAVEVAAASLAGWEEIELTIPSARMTEITLDVRRSHPGRPQHSVELGLDRTTGEVTEWETFADLSDERRAQQFLRYAHTGEYWGVVGQTLAALFSFVIVLMAWTGGALAVSRLKRAMAARRS